MSTEAVILIIALGLVLITVLGWMAGRAENLRARAANEALDARAVAPGYANEAAYANVAREAERSLRSERDVVLGDDDGTNGATEREREPLVDERAMRAYERDRLEAHAELFTEERDAGGRFAREDRVERRS